MASAGLEKEMKCSICRTLYTNPVTLTCGHHFCRLCIDQVLNSQDKSGVYSCPECRKEFPKRPSLKRNKTLRKLVENFRSNHGDDAATLCTDCVDSPIPAVKASLGCEASQCDKHLKNHNKAPESVLTDTNTSLENRKCSVHNNIMKYYCTVDAACICVSCCLSGKHQGHKLESLYEAFKKKREQLRNVFQKLTTKREKTEERVRSLEERKRKAQAKASVEAERVTALFIDLKRWVDSLEKKVLSDISKREEKVSLSLSDVIQKLEIQKDELSRKMRHIEELGSTTDPLTILQEPDTGDLSDPEEDGGDEDTGGHDEGDEDTGGHDGVELISHILHTLTDVTRDINVIFYVQDPADILLDVNTAHNNLLISNKLKTATWTEIKQNRPETAERFWFNQVMSGRGFTSGRHYWDVEISKSVWWSVGMCYPSMDRKGLQSFFGNNYKSWGLCGGEAYNNHYSVIHDNNDIQLPHEISSDRVRIYVDYEAGQLSFYELCDPIRHLHTFTTTFPEPLHAVLCVTRGFIKILGSSRKNTPS